MDSYASRVVDHYKQNDDFMYGINTGIVGISNDGKSLTWTGWHSKTGIKTQVVVAWRVGSYLVVREDTEDLANLFDATGIRSYPSVLNTLTDHGKNPNVVWTAERIDEDFIEQWKLVLYTKGI